MKPTKAQVQQTAVRRYRIRYLAPSVALLLLLIALFLPVLQYSTAANGTNQALSTVELMHNSWSAVREYLFGDSEQLSVTVSFSKALLVTLTVCTLCFLLGGTATVLYSVGAMRHLNDPKRHDPMRILWVTLFPSRAAECLWFLLLLPLLAFPRLLIVLYTVMLHSTHTLRFSPAEPLWLFVLFFIILCVLSARGSAQECAAGLSPFPSASATEQEPAATVSTSEEHRSSEEDEQMRKAREEQLQQIRKLLSLDGDEEEAKASEDADADSSATADPEPPSST